MTTSLSAQRPARSAWARRPRGFTLIELMVTVAVVGILAAVAYPSYVSHIRKTKRATAQSALMDIAAKQQAYLLDRRLYANALADIAFGVPRDIAADYAFNLVVDNAATPMTFVATATPINAQAAAGESALSVNQAGAKSPPGKPGYWGY